MYLEGAEDTTQGTAARGVQLVSGLGQGLALPESDMLPLSQIPICIMEIREPEGEKAAPYISSTKKKIFLCLIWIFFVSGDFRKCNKVHQDVGGLVLWIKLRVLGILGKGSTT